MKFTESIAREWHEMTERDRTWLTVRRDHTEAIRELTAVLREMREELYDDLPAVTPARLKAGMPAHEARYEKIISDQPHGAPTYVTTSGGITMVPVRDPRLTRPAPPPGQIESD